MDSTGKLMEELIDDYQRKVLEHIKILEEENAKMDFIVNKLSLLQMLSGSEFQSKVDEISTVQNTFKAKEATPVAVGAARLDCEQKQQKNNNYLAKIKISIKLYMNYNDRLTKDIKQYKSVINNSRKTLNNLKIMTKTEIETMELKIKRYENELLKLEKKYPWIKDEHCNLPHVQKEISSLNNLRTEKNKLLEELGAYQELKPDLIQAIKQLEEVKTLCLQ